MKLIVITVEGGIVISVEGVPQGYQYRINDLDASEGEKTTHDYVYCQDCKTYADFWKYDHDINAAGHGTCRNWRFVTESELKELVAECKRHGCFEE